MDSFTLISLNVLLSVVTLIMLFILYTGRGQNSTQVAINKLIDANKLLKEDLLREFKTNRDEHNENARANRTELTAGLDKLTEKLEVKLLAINEDQNKNAKGNREELKASLKDFGELFDKNVKDFNELQKQKFDAMSVKQDELVTSTELKLEKCGKR
jgi:hypothetical protein